MAKNEITTKITVDEMRLEQIEEILDVRRQIWGSITLS